MQNGLPISEFIRGKKHAKSEDLDSLFDGITRDAARQAVELNTEIDTIKNAQKPNRRTSPSEEESSSIERLDSVHGSNISLDKKSYIDLHNENNFLRETNCSLQKQLSNAAKHSEILNEAANNADQIRLELQEAERKSREKDCEIIELTEKLKKLSIDKETCIDLRKQLEEYHRKEAILREKESLIDETLKKYVALEDSNRRTRQKFHKLEKESESFQQQLKAGAEQIGELTKKLEQQRQENTSLIANVEKLKASHRKLTEEKGQAIGDNAVLRKSIEDLKKTSVAADSAEISHYRSKNRRLREKLKEAEAQLHSLSEALRIFNQSGEISDSNRRKS